MWWWLSFADESGNLGVAIVGPADDIASAAILAKMHDCNPGGEVLGFPAPPDIEPLIMDDERFRLLSKDEALELDRQIMARHDN